MIPELNQQVEALSALLESRSLIDPQVDADYRKAVTEQWTHRNGALLCARAWVDPGFKGQLMRDGREAAASMGFAMPPHHARLVVKENTEHLHNVVCCTLCSCSPFTIIGIVPSWYKNLEYRARIVREARSTLAELGLHLPDDMQVRVWDTTTDTRYMVLPMRPTGTAGWSEERLAELVTQDALIGAARPGWPSAATGS